jgi:hypothetical protein
MFKHKLSGAVINSINVDTNIDDSWTDFIFNYDKVELKVSAVCLPLVSTERKASNLLCRSLTF